MTKIKLYILIGIGIFIITSGLPYFLYNLHIQKLNQESIKYGNTTNIDQNSINYALDTQMGLIGIDNVNINAVDPITFPLLKGSYLSLSIIHEEYVMKTKKVTKTDSDGNKTTELKTYWEWDRTGRKDEISEKTSLNGIEVASNLIQFNEKRLDLSEDLITRNKTEGSFFGFKFGTTNYIDGNYFYTDSDSRYEFYYVPSKFTAKSVFAKAGDSLLPINKKIEIYDKSVKELKDEKKSNVNKAISHQFLFSILIGVLSCLTFALVLFFTKGRY